MSKKEVERICKNCLLFDPKNNLCSVVLLFEGRKVKLPVDPEDPCFFEQEFYNEDTKEKETFQIQQIRMWQENDRVKIEYPDN